ncbi:helix-turn-helix transcriptional regulator [Enterococcus sp.]|uniref:helix-turn-helix domain-containing protein n=1 Tax=Enterococcus sp. TaxID=35783 RepID=UPI00289A6A91|nr:helix-turn-helix transcriptional regulator [Enterococcus sp.]
MARGRGQLTPKEVELRKIISDNINDLLDKSGRKQIDIHRSTGIPKSTLTGYVKGTSMPTLGNVQKLAKFFGVSKSLIDPRFSPSVQSVVTSGSSIETIYNELDEHRQQKVYNFAKHQLQEQTDLEKSENSLDETLTIQASQFIADHGREAYDELRNEVIKKIADKKSNEELSNQKYHSN